MYLKSLVLKGFKSFADRSVLVFQPGISAIVGPNGSGKSNISDAVLWVLGELNPKNLRGNSMQDVVFAGSSARKPVSMAEVTLVLDNSDGTLPVDYDEVSIGRRMYRTGESEYLVNGVVARRLDVLDILHDSGLGTGTSSIISQGHLSSVLASKPEDRRALIEEAAGVLKHKQRKERSMRKLARMDDSMVRVADVVAEVQRQVRPLARKAHKAKAHAEAEQRLSEVRLALAVDDLRGLKDEWAQAGRAKDKAARSAAERAKAADAAQEALHALQRQADEGAASSARTSEQHRRAQAVVDRLESNVMLLHQREQSARDYVGEMGGASDAQQERLRALQRDLEQAQAALLQGQEDQRAKRAAREEAAKRDAAAKEALSGAQAKASATDKERRAAAQRLLESQRDLDKRRSSLAAARSREASSRSRVERLAQELGQAKDESKRASEAAQAVQDEAASAEGAAKQAKGALQDARAFRDKARAALDDAQDAVSAARASVTGIAELEHARTQGNPMLSWADGHPDGMPEGTRRLIDEMEVPSELASLVARLLGDDVDALVAGSPDDALDGVRAASDDGRGGRLTVLAPTGVDAVAHEAAQAPQGCSRLVERLGCSSAARGAAEELLGDVWLCPDEASARECARAVEGARCVAPDGLTVCSTGRATMDRSTDGQDNPVERHRRLAQAKRAQAKATDALEAARKGMKEAQAAFDKAQAADVEAGRGLARLQGALDSAQAEARRCANRVDSLSKQHDDAAQRLAQAVDEVADAEPKVNDALAALQKAQEASNASEEAARSASAALDPARQAADGASRALSTATAACTAADERVRSARSMADQRSFDISSQKAQIARSHAGIARKQVALRRVGPLIDVFSSLVSEAKVRAATLSDAAHDAQSSARALHGRIEEADRALAKARREVDAANEAVSDARVEAGRLETRVDVAVHTITDDLATPLDRALQLPALEDRHKAEEEAFSLQKRLDRMGSVDADAAQEYEQAKSRLDFLQSQMRDMREARASLDKIVSAIDERMQHDFTDAFNQVNANYQRIFHTLFPGGQGHLELSDPDDPEGSGVEVVAQPRGKRFLKMSLLSGGEQSLVAMALLFAVYQTRSTPFYILDEVEAALDDTNLRRLLSYIDSMRDSMQFIAITHQRRTMELADVLYGVSMHADGVSKVLSQRLDKATRQSAGQ